MKGRRNIPEGHGSRRGIPKKTCRYGKGKEKGTRGSQREEKRKPKLDEKKRDDALNKNAEENKRKVEREAKALAYVEKKKKENQEEEKWRLVA
jgi:hypothetical protein